VVDLCLGLDVACPGGLSVSLRGDPTEEIAQEDDDHPAQEPNGPIGDGERQHGEWSADEESENDDVEEELTGPARAAHGAAMPEDQSGQQAEGQPSADNQTGGM
jgi:hypothetical protein